MGHALQLVADRRVQFRHPVAMDVAPQRGNAVEVLAAIDVHQEAAVGALDDQGPFRGVGLHGGEGMPQVLVVPLFELLACWFHK